MDPNGKEGTEVPVFPNGISSSFKNVVFSSWGSALGEPKAKPNCHRPVEPGRTWLGSVGYF